MNTKKKWWIHPIHGYQHYASILCQFLFKTYRMSCNLKLCFKYRGRIVSITVTTAAIPFCAHFVTLKSWNFLISCHSKNSYNFQKSNMKLKQFLWTAQISELITNSSTLISPNSIHVRKINVQFHVRKINAQTQLIWILWWYVVHINYHPNSYLNWM